MAALVRIVPRRRVGGVVLAGIITTSVAVAHAQPAGAQAEALFRDGRTLMAAGNYAEACTAFEQSQKLEPAVSTLLNLAGCREKAGQLASAWGLFLEAERRTREGTDRSTAKLHEVARDRAARLEPRVSHLTISVPLQSQVDGLAIARDGEPIDPAMWNRALPVDGGAYTITARAPGANAWSTAIEVAAESDTRTVAIPDLRNLPRDLGPTPPAAGHVPAPRAAAPHPAVSTAPAHGHRAVVPIAIGGGALLLFGGALGMKAWGDATYADARAEVRDQGRRDALYGAANTRRYAAGGLAIAGVAAAGVALWWFLDRRGEAPAARAIARRIVVAPTGLALMGEF